MSYQLSCLTCARAFEHAGGNAAGYAILLMLIVLVFVLGTVAIIMVRMGRRSKACLEDCYRDDYVPADAN